MKNILLFLLIPVWLFAQSEKPGIPPTTKSIKPLIAEASLPAEAWQAGAKAGKAITRAVVVGISDYQSPEIPDLQFANKDAEAFADWLQSPAGGSIPADRVQLLTNEKATNYRLAMALTGLIDDSKAGDEAIFYFSGHGDVESKTVFQLGFLLPWDSQGQNYMACAFSLYNLQAVISTLSAKNVRVIIITDACHAGKLAGSAIGGPQLTSENLTKQFANEVKILSCQPNEFSLEGTQWDGGRGVFSYHLLEGLKGLADKDGDESVSLYEIGRYLEDHVPAEAAPQKQLPLIFGDRATSLAQVNAAALEDLRKSKLGQAVNFSPIKSKGLEDAILGLTDSTVQVQYRSFVAALENKELLESTAGRLSANDLFPILIQNEQLAELHGLMRRNFAAALLDEVQQALNALLGNDPYEANRWKYNPQKYATYPAYLQRSMELLGENHYMYRDLLAKKRYFEGYNLHKNVGDLENQPALRDSFKMDAKAKFLESIELEPDAAYPYFSIGEMNWYNFPNQTDSLIKWCNKAVEIAPNWLAPYLLIADEYASAWSDFTNAETWISKALMISPNNYQVLLRLSWLKQWQGKYDESLMINQDMIALKPDLFDAYSTIATNLCGMKCEYLESEKYCLKSLEIEPHQSGWANGILEQNYLKSRRAKQVVESCKKRLVSSEGTSSREKSEILKNLVAALVQLDSFKEAEYYFQLSDSLQFGSPEFRSEIKREEGRMYLKKGQLEKAEKALQAATHIAAKDDTDWISIYSLLGEIYALRSLPVQAEGYFLKAISSKTGFWSNYFIDEAVFHYGRFLLDQHRTAEAETQFRKIGQILPKSYYHGYGMALLAAKTGKSKTEILDWLEQSLDNFWPDAASVYAEPLFKKIRKTARFKALMIQNFPDYKS